jgi:Mg-chelatase subunit ChlD
MSDKKKKEKVQEIDNIVTRGSTNIFSAVAKAIEIIENRKDRSRNPAIMLFTDG